MNTRKGVERIIRAAFAFADKHGHPSVCMADKSNAMRHGHDLWQRVFERSPPSTPTSRPSTSTSTCWPWMVRRPGRFDVIVTNNLFGDIVATWVLIQGGITAASGIREPRTVLLVRARPWLRPDIAGQGLANSPPCSPQACCSPTSATQSWRPASAMPSALCSGPGQPGSVPDHLLRCHGCRSRRTGSLDAIRPLLLSLTCLDIARDP